MEKASHLRDMSDEQLSLTLKDATKTLFKLLIQAQTERLTSSSELKKYRRYIARIKTVQRERELKAERQTAKAVETLTTNP